MSAENPELLAFLDDPKLGQNSSMLSADGDSGSNGNLPFSEPDYTGKIDYRIRQLSYSSLLTLHSCPRKFQLYKLRTTARTVETEKSTVTFSFGHVVGEAIQNIFEGKSEQEVFFRLFLGWHAPFFAVDDKGKKSIWYAMIAVQTFLHLRKNGFLADYELVYYQGKPATELSFCINLPDSFRLRGHVDAVLRHKVSGKIIVLECKTTGFTTLNPATYKNSSQAIGYSIVLDAIFPDLSSYEVIYLIYQTGSREFTTFNFAKSYLQRAQWIQELLLDVETIKLYEGVEVYPMHGESCLAWNRECEYYQSCTLSTQYLAKPMTADQADTTEYQINLSLMDLLQTQLRKSNPEELAGSNPPQIFNESDTML